MSQERRAKLIRGLPPSAANALLYDWTAIWARPEQLPPAGDWRVWLLLAGRGFGKSRTGAEYIRARVEAGVSKRIALVGRTAGDVRDVMVEGESGIMAVSPPWCRPHYEPSKRRLTWPNGAMATTYSADEPASLRGPQHDDAWADELASWEYPDSWNQLMLGLRLGRDPRVAVSTTPKPTKLIKELVERAKDPKDVRVTKGSTYDNRANLAAAFVEQIVKQYEGTRLGRQELWAEILDDVPGALWARSLIDRLRVKVAPPMRRIVVAIDPSVTAKATSDECGIVTAGFGIDGHGYVLDDLSGRMTPREWGTKAVVAFRDRQADRIVAEVNNGGDLVEVNLRTIAGQISYKGVHAARGKRTRAEPVASLYERGLVHHVGMFAKLEDEMSTWDPTLTNESPNRLDALVWALTDLMLEPVVYRNLTNLPPG
jgi:phage terminase large subunit-like protein